MLGLFQFPLHASSAHPMKEMVRVGQEEVSKRGEEEASS